jgi:hypothetical protein
MPELRESCIACSASSAFPLSLLSTSTCMYLKGIDQSAVVSPDASLDYCATILHGVLQFLVFSLSAFKATECNAMVITPFKLVCRRTQQLRKTF